MNVLFIKPPIGGIIGLEQLTFVEPLGPECVAGSLEPLGHKCMILDLRIEGETLEKGWAFEPQVVGIQCNFTTERFRTLKIARAVKQHRPDIFVLIGGHDAAREPEFFQGDAVDAVAIGDGEDIAPLLLEALERGKDLRKVPGLMLNTPDGPFFTGHAPARSDLDLLPLPSRHLIKHYAPHYYINFRKPLALLETARGCPYRCNFCSVWKFHEKTFREKSPERVVAELKQIDAPSVFITDDIFWLNVERGKEMARQIKAAGIKKWFTVQTRTDIICRHPEVIEMWKDCGNLSIFLGLEKIDDEGLKSVNKHNKADNNVRAIELLKEMKVGFASNFIVDPDWDYEDFAKLREWLYRHGAYNSGFTILTPLPGTDLYDEVKDTLTTDDWEMFDLAHTVLPTKLPLEEFYAEYAKLYRTTLDVRVRHTGRLKPLLKLIAALVTRKVTLGALRKGMNMSKVFSNPETFLRKHRENSANKQAAGEAVAVS